MAFRIKDVNEVVELHRKIKLKSTGTPEEFAESLGISRSWLYQNINDLKALGAEINYSRIQHTFYYKNNFDIKILMKEK